MDNRWIIYWVCIMAANFCVHCSARQSVDAATGSARAVPVEAPLPPLVDVQSAAGDPATIGCADGQREGFADLGRFPTIAACEGNWAGPLSLRAAPTGKACGDDAGACAVPADLCATGWRVCGSDGAVSDLARITAAECENVSNGRYVGAMSHCKEQEGCVADSPGGRYPCFASGWCAEPVCCGRGCLGYGACRSGVWPDRTHTILGQDHGCAKMPPLAMGGVLCCK